MFRRHKLAFAAASTVVATLVIGFGVSTWLFVQEKRALGAATQAEATAKQAQQQTTEKLYESYLAQARANRLSGQPGRYFNTMEIIAKAVAIRPSLELRKEAIAGLALDDLRMIPLGEANPPGPGGIVFDPTLELFARVTAEGDITVRRVRDNQETATIRCRELGVRWLHAFSPNGRYLAFHTDTASHCVWDLQERKLTFQDLALTPGGGLLFSPTENSFVSANPDGSISTYELESHQVTRGSSKVSPGSVVMALDRSGLRLASFNSATLIAEIVDVKTGAVTVTMACPDICDALAWSQDGKWLGAACGNARAYIWDASSGELLQTCVGHDEWITKLAFNQAGTLLATTSWDDTTRLWDPSSGAQLLSFPGSSYQLQFSPDDQRLGHVVQGTKFGLFEMAKHPEYRCLSPTRRSGRGGALAIDPDNRFIAAVVEGQVRFWDLTSGQEIGFLPEFGCASVFFDTDGKRLITSGLAGLASWPIQHGTGLATDTIRIGPRQPIYPTGNTALLYASMSLAGGRIAMAVADAGEARVIDLANPDKVVKLKGHPGMRHVSMSPDAKWVATGTWNGSGVKVWDVQSGSVVHEFPEPAHGDVLFSPNGRWLVTGGVEYHLWETETWRPGPLISLKSKNFPVGVMAFSRDSQLLAIAYGRRAVRLLEAKTGRTLADFEAPALSLVKGLCFSGDGSQLLASDGLGQMHVWDLRLVRQRLSTMKLDWDMPPYAAEAEKQSPRPLRLEVVPSKSAASTLLLP